MKKLLFVVALALAGCSTEIGKFSVLSSQTIDPAKTPIDVDVSKRVVGMDEATFILIFPTNFVDIQTALNDACSKAPESIGLCNVSVRREWFWFLFGYNDLVVEGNPIYKAGRVGGKGTK